MKYLVRVRRRGNEEEYLAHAESIGKAVRQVLDQWPPDEEVLVRTCLPVESGVVGRVRCAPGGWGRPIVVVTTEREVQVADRRVAEKLDDHRGRTVYYHVGPDGISSFVPAGEVRLCG